MSRWVNLVAMIVVAGCLILAGCGSSGNSVSASNVSGVAATGSPISGAAYIKDSSGVEKSQQIASDGSFSFVVDGMKAPFMLKAEWTPTGGTTQKLYSFVSSAGRCNINPIGNLAVNSAAGVSGIAALYNTPDSSTLQALATALPAAVNALRTGNLKPLFDQYTNIDPIKDSFSADHTGFDKLLDDVTITTTSGGAVTVTNKSTGATIFTSTFSDLGSGTFNQGNLPAAATTVASMKISAGFYTSMALKADGTVWAWGNNSDGQIGDNTTTSRSTPVQVQGLSTVIDIVTGDNTPVALKVDGTVWIWGRDQRNVNINTMIAPSIKLPQQLTGISQVTAISAGHSHGIALKADGTVWWWGRYNYPITVAAVPTQVQGLSGVKAITSDYALKTDGTLWKLNISSTPTQVTSLSGVSSLIQVSAGGSIPYAIKTDGGIWKLGTTPTQVTNLSGLTVISDSVGIGNLAYSTVALKSDGTVWNWEASASPIQVSGLSGITAISTGSHVLVLKSDGSVWSWGLNRDGGLGDGTTTDRATPVQVSGILLK